MNNSNPHNSNNHSKDKHFQAQMRRVYAEFKRNPATMLMVAEKTGIYRANICRYVAKWRKQGKLWVSKIDCCKISRHKAEYLTTEKPYTGQLSILDQEGGQ